MEDLLNALNGVKDAVSKIENGESDVTIKDMIIMSGAVGNLKIIAVHATQQVEKAIQARQSKKVQTVDD